MIKPSEIKPANAPFHTQEQLESLEERFDAAIRSADRTGQWPAVVGRARDAMPYSAIEAVVGKYKAEGWVVSAGFISNAIAIISRPPG
jgi:hypothetical protein